MPKHFSDKTRKALSVAAKERDRSGGYSAEHAKAISAGVARYWERRRKLGLALTNRTESGNKKHSAAMQLRNGHKPYSGVLKKAYKKFCVHKADAKRRGVAFIISFDDWWAAWKEHWSNRGGRLDQYCMARGTSKCPDTGPYEIGNIRIITNRENREEQGSPRTRKKGG